MSEEQPEAEDRLGKNVKDSIGNNFGVEPDETTTVGDAPDAAQVLA